MSKSLYSADKRIVFYESFQSEAAVRKNGGVPTNVTFNNDVGVLSGNIGSGNYYVKYGWKFNTSRYSIRIKVKISALSTVGSFYLVGIRSTTSISSGLYIYNGVLYLDHIGGYITLNSSPIDNLYHEYVVTKNLTAFEFFKDGNKIGSGTVNNNFSGFPFVGYDSTNANKTIEISLAEIYNKALTASEVKLLYNQNLYSNLPAVITDNTPNCFEGNNNAYIEVNDNNLLSFGDGVTNQSFWVSMYAYSTKQGDTTIRYVAKESSSVTTEREYRLFFQTSSGFYFFDVINTNSTSYLRVSTNINLSFNPVHLLFAYNGSKTILCYINGVLIASSTTEVGTFIAMQNSPTPITLGTNAGSSAKLLQNNFIWDVRIGSGTLTTQQVQDIYQGKAVGTERLWLPLCENAGNTRFDVSGNGFHGTLKGTQDGKYNVGKQNKFDYYSLTGDNPVQDLIGNIHGTISMTRPINIPLLASNSQPVLPAMTDVSTTLPVVQRSFREVFRINANKGIVDQYGKPLTINGNVNIKQVGKGKGIYFGGTTSDYINCGNILNTELKDGFVIKLWYKPITMVNLTNVFSLKNSFLGYGASNTYRFNINNGGSVNTMSAIKPNMLTLYIICVDREVSTSFCFNGSTFIGQTNLTGQYFVPNTNSLIFGSLTVPSKFILLDVSISTAGQLSLEEATQVWVSEKINYF